MTYTKYRSTQETLQTLDSLELDTVRSSPDDLIKKFGWEDDSSLKSTGHLPQHKRLAMIIWQLFEEPRSSIMSKVRVLRCFSLFEKTSWFSICLGHRFDFYSLYSSLDYYVHASNLLCMSNNRIRFYQCLCY